MSRKRLKACCTGKKKFERYAKSQWKSRKAGLAKKQKEEKKATAILPVNPQKKGRFQSHTSKGINELKEIQRSKDPRSFNLMKKLAMCSENVKIKKKFGKAGYRQCCN